MLRDEAMPLTAFTAPPEDNEKAVERVNVLAANSLLGLIGSVFLTVDQLRKALSECGWHEKDRKALMDSGRTKTHRIGVVARNGCVYELIVNETAGWKAEIVNCRLAKPGGDWTDDDVREVKEATQ